MTADREMFLYPKAFNKKISGLKDNLDLLIHIVVVSILFSIYLTAHLVKYVFNKIINRQPITSKG